MFSYFHCELWRRGYCEIAVQIIWKILVVKKHFKMILRWDLILFSMCGSTRSSSCFKWLHAAQSALAPVLTHWMERCVDLDFFSTPLVATEEREMSRMIRPAAQHAELTVIFTENTLTVLKPHCMYVRLLKSLASQHHTEHHEASQLNILTFRSFTWLRLKALACSLAELAWLQSLSLLPIQRTFPHLNSTTQQWATLRWETQ